MDVTKYLRGTVWYYTDNIEDKQKGERGILRGDRPVLIISDVKSLGNVHQMTYLPITSASTVQKKYEDFETKFYLVPIQLPGSDSLSYVSCNQIRPGVTNHMHKFLGVISEEKMQMIEKELLRYLGMSKYQTVDEFNKSINQTVNSFTIESTNTATTATPPLHEDTHTTVLPVKRAVICLEDELFFPTKTSAAEYYDMNDKTFNRRVNKGQTIKGKRVVSIQSLIDLYYKYFGRSTDNE